MESLGILMLSQNNIKQDKLVTTFKYWIGPKASNTHTCTCTHTLNIIVESFLKFCLKMFLWNVDIVDSPLRGEYLTHFLMRKNVETHYPRHIKVDWVVECDCQQRKHTDKQKILGRKKKKKARSIKCSVLQLLHSFHLSFQAALFWWLFSCETTGADAEIMKYWKPQTTEMSVTGNGHPPSVY